MNPTYTRWTIGVLATGVWFWGNRAGIPPEAIQLAAVIVPGLIGHTLGMQAIKATPP